MLSSNKRKAARIAASLPLERRLRVRPNKPSRSSAGRVFDGPSGPRVHTVWWRVERSLYERAVGYNYEATKIFMPANREKPDGILSRIESDAKDGRVRQVHRARFS